MSQESSLPQALGPLLQFAREIDRGDSCNCESCQVRWAALAVIEMVRTKPSCIAVRSGETSPHLEALGLMCAAVTVLMCEISERGPNGRPVFALEELVPRITRVLSEACEHFELPAVVGQIMARPVAAPRGPVH